MSVQRLLKIVASLRSENGCPWDREQTLESLKQHLIEESYELVEAIDSGDSAKHCEELGDVLLQVVLQARMREEKGDFSFDDVVETLCEKLVRRHPHVFGKTKVSDSAEVLKNWEAIKAEEKRCASGKKTVKLNSSVSNVPRSLPALRKAFQVQERAARFGLDCPAEKEAERRARRALGEQARASKKTVLKKDLGDLLFALVSLGREQGVNAEDALADSIARFVRDFPAENKKTPTVVRQTKTSDKSPLKPASSSRAR